MNKRTIRIAAIAALTSLTTSLVSCVIDTPQTIAWSYYWCAKDTMDAGKVDSLRLVIEKAIEEDKKTGKDSLTIKQ